ncbi:MAG: hypothetical protein J6Y93_06875, partial [Treponema sp.]|nr:hypothetical protein [Treponema sp.]
NIRYYLEGDDSSKKTVRFQPVSQDYGITNGLLVYDSTEWWEGETVTVVSENKEIEADTVYKVIPQFNTDQGSFYVEIPEDLEIFYDSNASAPPEISHKAIMCGIEKADELIYDENYYGEDRYLPALKLTLTLKEGIYDDYDLVWAQLDDFTKKSFDRENLSVSFLVETESLFNDDVVFTVYGIKNGVRNSGTDITFPVVTGEERITYDNMPPRAYLDEDVETDWEHIALRTGDLGSGSEKGIFNIQFIADESNSYSVVLPLRNIVVEQGLDNYGNMVTQHNFYVDYEITDKAGNCTTGTLKHDIGYIPKVERIIKSDSTNWKLLSEEYESGEGGDTNRYQVYTIDENNVWTPYDLDNNRFTVDVYTSGTGLLYYQSQWPVTLPQNSFIKLQVSIYNGRPSVPSYFYTGTQNTGKYDYIQPLSKKAFLIASDAPVYVQTFITTKPYSQCKDWGIREWEYYNDHTGEK